jgi:hypothetical protein
VQAHADRAPAAEAGHLVDQTGICGKGHPKFKPPNYSSMTLGRGARRPPGGAL